MDLEDCDAYELRDTLVLANKYQMDSVSTRIIRRIEAGWPTSFEQHYIARKTFHNKLEYLDTVPDRWERVEYQFPEPASAIRLATEHRILRILPAAFYRLAINDVSVGWEDEKVLDMGAMSARWGLLEKEDWMRYNRGKIVLISCFDELLPNCEGSGLADNCKQRDICAAALEEPSARLRDMRTVSFAQRPDVLGCAIALREDLGKMSFCHCCTRELRTIFTDFLETVCFDLPDIFALTVST